MVDKLCDSDGAKAEEETSDRRAKGEMKERGGGQGVIGHLRQHYVLKVTLLN